MGKALLIPVILLALMVRHQGKANLTITVRNIRNSQGMINFSVFGKDGFPKNTSKALRIEYVPIVKGISTITFRNLPEGEYAVAVFHDENNNKKLDANIVGMPKEGVGASNNAKGHFGPPSYNDARFRFSVTGLAIEIDMTYF